MDFCDEILEETDRYAFLLGSALRNQDHEQFLEIYDRIIPKDLDSKEVEAVKERARQLASVSEEEFATVAVRARDYSLAQPQYTSYVMYDDNTTEELSKIESMRGTASISSISSLNSDFPSDLCHMENNKPDLSSLVRTSRHFGPQSEAEFSISDASDSGIGLNNSSKLGSVSDNDENERPGVFDYVQTRPEPKVEIINVKTFNNSQRITTNRKNNVCTNNSGGRITVHNEQYLTRDNDDEELESIRSDDSSGSLLTRSKAKFEKEIEMVKIHRDCESPDCETQVLLCPEVQKVQRKVARKKNNQMYDEAFVIEESNSVGSLSQDSGSSDQELKQVVIDSDDYVDINAVNVHRYLYDGPTQYLPMNRDEEYMEDDDHENSMRALQRLDSHPRKTLSSFNNQSSYEKEVEFRSKQYYNSRRSYDTFTTGVRDVDSNVNFGLSSGVRVEKKESVKTTQSGPPFDHPLNLEKMGRANNKLLKGTFCDNLENYRNMPEGEVIKNDGKKKKKHGKKKKAQSSASGGGSGGKDNEEGEDKSLHDINGNPLEEGRAKPSSKQLDTFRSSESSFPARYSQFESSYYSPLIRDHEDIMPTVDQKYHEKKARKNKKKEQEDKRVITSDKIPGHRGNDQLDSLLDFIEGQKGQRKQKREHQPASPQQQQHRSDVDSVELTNRSIIATPTTIASNTSTTKKSEKTKKKKNKDNSIDSVKDNKSDGSSVSDIKEVTMGPNGLPIETTSESTINADNAIVEQKDNIYNSDDHIGADSVPTSILDPYIFPEFEYTKPPTEAAFQTVSFKKKKKNFSKEPDVRVNGTVKGSFPIGGENNSNKRLGSGAREYVNNFRQRQQGNNRYSAEKRSYTPPPTPTSVVETKPNDRAFSPSAFPALAKNTSGRRYSTGDAKEIEVEKEVDSDMESVKSVPAAVITTTTDRTQKVENKSVLSSLPAGIRPLPVVSYAKVVGRQQQQQNHLKPTSSLDDPVSDDIQGMDEESCNVSNSNPERERRHSLGNMPMPVPSHLDGFNQGVARSQELVNGERTSSSGTSSLSTSSKASSLSNSKYGSTENLRENSPHPEVTIPLNPSSETDFPPITTSHHHHHNGECNQQHIQNNISSNTTTDITNKWISPPSLIHNSQPTTTTSQSIDNVSIQNNNVVVRTKITTTHTTTEDSTVCAANAINNNTKQQQQSSMDYDTNNKMSVHNRNSSSHVSNEQQTNANKQSKGITCSISSSSSNSSYNNKVASQLPQPTATPTVNSSSVTNSNKGQHRKPPSVGQSSVHVTKPHSSKTTQSVIFLDRKFSEQTPNLGISFGYEPELELTTGSNDNNVDHSYSNYSSKNNVIPSHSSNKEGNLIVGHKNSKNVINCGQDCSSNNEKIAEVTATKQVIGQSNNVIATPMSSNNSGKCKTVTHPPNGIVVQSSINKHPQQVVTTSVSSSPTPQPNQVITEQSIDNNDRVCYTIEQKSINSTDITFSAEIVLTSSSTPQDNCTIYASNRNTFTSCEATMSESGITCNTTSYVWPKLPSREHDPNYQSGSYDREKVTSYLYNEWCHFMQDGDKVCDGVALYGRDLN